jgi:hypothetical protein
METFQVTRSYYLRRMNYAWWNAKKHDNGNGMWHVHFHADYVPSRDWTAQNEYEVLVGISLDMMRWMIFLQKHFKSQN